METARGSGARGPTVRVGAYPSPATKREKLYELGSGYRQQLEKIFTDAAESGELRRSIDCHFAAQAVIGLCNAWGELIVRDPDLDLAEVIEKCVDLLLNGFLKN